MTAADALFADVLDGPAFFRALAVAARRRADGEGVARDYEERAARLEATCQS